MTRLRVQRGFLYLPWAVALSALVLALMNAASAQAPSTPAAALASVGKPGGPAWGSLSSAQREALAPLQREWANIDVDRRSKWLEIASRFPSMPAAERQRVQERMAQWSRLTPNERGQARMQFQESRQLGAEDRNVRWQAYQALPEQTRRDLAQQAIPAATPPAAGTNRGSATLSSKPSTVTAKRNIVVGPDASVARSVSPTVVRANPGATTTLVSRAAAPPNHQQPGLPKIAATEGFVNPKTLLPKRGPQGAAVRTTAAASEPSPSQ